MAKKENADLPRTIPELRGPLSQNEYEVQKHKRTYNSLPVGHPDKRKVYDKIQEAESFNDFD